MAKKPTYEELQQRVKELEKEVVERRRLEEQMQLLSLAVEQSSEGIAVVDLDDNLEYLNDAFAEMHGYSPEELVGKNLSIFHTPQQMLCVEEANREVKETGEFKGEIWHVRRNGTVFPTLMHNSLIRNDMDKPIGMLGTLRDISSIKQAEDALRESEEKYRNLVERANDGITIIQDTIVKYVNPRLAEMWGGKIEEIIGTPFTNYVHSDDLAKVADRYKRRMAGEDITPLYEAGLMRKDGSKAHVELNAGLITYEGKPAELVMVRDITERKQAEEALRASALSWETTFDAITDSVCLIDMEGKILQCNKATANFLGKPINEIVGNTCWELVHGTSEPFKGCPIVRMRETLRPESLELAVGDRVLYVATDPILDQDGNLTKAVHAITDITERKQTEEALHESEERLKIAGKVAYDLIYEWTVEDDKLEWFGNIDEILGYKPKEIPRTIDGWVRIIHPEDIVRLKDAVEEHRTSTAPISYEYRVKHKNGSWRYWSDHGMPMLNYEGLPYKWIGVCTDITERKQAEEERDKLQAQLSNAIEMAHLGHWEYDVVNDLFTFNDHFYKIFRTTAKQVGGYTMSSAEYARRFVHPDDMHIVEEETRKAIEATDPHFSRQLEHRMLYADGTVGHITVRFFIVKDAQGKTVKTYGVNQDITERKLTEEALRQSEKKYRSLVESTEDSIYLLDRDCMYLFMNKEHLSTLKPLLAVNLIRQIG